MSESASAEIGSIGWVDLTVPNAEAVRDFYRDVVGWTMTEVEMGGYSDFCMNKPGSNTTVAGICHARGVNAALPPQWLVYITVQDVDKSAARCVELGGEIIMQPKSAGGQSRYCVIRDPAGAVAALYAPGPAQPEQPVGETG